MARSTGGVHDDDARPSSWLDRLKGAVLKPVEPGVAPSGVAEMSADELEVAEASLNDRERLIGLIAGPLAALVGFLIVNADINNDPVQYLVTGTANPKYTSVSLYHELEVVLLVLAALMIVTSLWRKRLYLGIVLALYGLAVFNLHYWGFGIPFVLGGAWYLVRAYRIRQALAALGRTTRPARGSSGQPRQSKRYTPPTPGRRRPKAPED